MSNLFVVDISHECDNHRGRYERLQTVYHLHNEFENHRCELVEDQYRCLGCKQTFNLEEVKNSPRRDINKTKRYWLELIPTGQHLPVDSQDSYWYHVHPEDDLSKRKEAKLSMNIYATCPVCKKDLHLHLWKEKADNQKTLVFSGIVVEILQISTWIEIEIFRKKGVEIWLKDKLDKYFLLSASGQLLPAEKQGDILCCGNEMFLDNDHLKSLLFVFDEELSQEMADQHLNNGKNKKEDESFHLNIPMLAEEQGIPQKPETLQKKHSTQEFASGDLATVQEEKAEREPSKEIAIIIDDNSVRRIEIPKHYEVNLEETTPLPEDAHPLLVTDNETYETGNDSDEDPWEPKTVLVMNDIPQMIITTERNEVSGEISMPIVADAGLLPAPDFSETEDHWFAEMEPPVEETAEPSSEPATNVAESHDDGVAPMALAITDELIAQENTMALGDAPTTLLPIPDEPEDKKSVEEELDAALESAKLAETEANTMEKLEQAEAELAQANAVLEQLIMQSMVSAIASEPTTALGDAPTAALPTITEPEKKAVSRHCWECDKSMPANQACPDHEKSCPHCGMANSLNEQQCRSCKHDFGTPSKPIPATDDNKPEPAITESANTGPSDAPAIQPIPANDHTRQCIICGKMMQSSPLTGEEVCNEHEKSCFICATVNPKEAIFCGGCGSGFTKKGIMITHREALLKAGLAVSAVAIVLLMTIGFAKLITNFQRDDLKAELKAAEMQRMELSSRTNKLRVEADLIRFDLMENQQKLENLRNNVPQLQAEQAKLTETLDRMENRLSNVWAWQADVQEFLVKAKNQLQADFAKLKDEARNDRLAWQRQERERIDLCYWENSFLPPLLPPQKPTQNTPPAVDKSSKDKNTAIVDKSKKPHKLAEKIKTIDINSIARSYEQ